jgi:flagellar biosynthesis/type III secretory pathway M-ring protein FliF/YscJ
MSVETDPEEEIVMSVGSSAVGKAEVSESMLTGKEVDPETLRFQEIGKEVSQMVENDPAGSADLIRRWLNDS